MGNSAGPCVQGVLDPIASYYDHPLGHYKTPHGHSKESLKRLSLNMTTPPGQSKENLKRLGRSKESLGPLSTTTLLIIIRPPMVILTRISRGCLLL